MPHPARFRTQTQRERIIQWLRDNPGPHKSLEVIEALNIGRSSGFVELSHLVSQGRILRVAKGTYMAIDNQPTEGEGEREEFPQTPDRPKPPGNTNLQFRMIAELEGGAMLLQYTATNDFFVAKMVEIKDIIKVENI